MDRFQRKRAVVAIKTIVCVAFLVLVVVCVMTFVLYFQAVRGLEMCEQRRVQTLYSLRHTGEQANSRERTVGLTVESVTKLKAPTVHECDCPRVTPAADGAINPIDKLKDTSDRVRVIVLTILKDGQSFGTGRTAEDYARLVSSLDYPDVDLSVGVLASDHEVLQNLRKTFKDFGRRLKSVSLFHRKLDSDNIGRDDGQRHAPSIQKKRRTMLARYRNTLISLALGKNDNFVLWIDADMKKIPEVLLPVAIKCLIS